MAEVAEELVPDSTGLAAAVATLRRIEPALRLQGVTAAAVFGSVARNEAQAGSDVDVLVELDPTGAIDLFDYAAIVQTIEQAFACPVDVANARTLKPLVREEIQDEAVRAF